MTISSTRQCNRGCGTDIYFNSEVKSTNGKSIPLECDNDQPHNCPNSGFKSNKFIGEEVMDLEKKERGV